MLSVRQARHELGTVGAELLSAVHSRARLPARAPHTASLPPVLIHVQSFTHTRTGRAARRALQHPRCDASRVTTRSLLLLLCRQDRMQRRERLRQRQHAAADALAVGGGQQRVKSRRKFIGVPAYELRAQSLAALVCSVGVGKHHSAQLLLVGVLLGQDPRHIRIPAPCAQGHGVKAGCGCPPPSPRARAACLMGCTCGLPAKNCHRASYAARFAPACPCTKPCRLLVDRRQATSARAAHTAPAPLPAATPRPASAAPPRCAATRR